MRPKSHLLRLLFLLPVLVAGCSTGTPATKADYDKITKGMTKEDVSAVLTGLGPAQPATPEEATKPLGPYSFGSEEQAKVLAELTLFKWGGGQEYVFAGFDKEGKVRAKTLRTKNQTASETFNVMIVNGKVMFPPEHKKRPVAPGAPVVPRSGP